MIALLLGLLFSATGHPVLATIFYIWSLIGLLNYIHERNKYGA